MQDRAEQLKQLLEKSEWTTEEKQWLSDYLQNSEGGELKLIMDKAFSSYSENEKIIDQHRSEKIFKDIHEKIGDQKTTDNIRTIRYWKLNWAIAASLMLILSMGVYLLFVTQRPKQVADTTVKDKIYKNDVAPGGDKAELTLANGMKIILDSALNGSLASQGITQINRQQGQLIYSVPSHSGAEGEVMYNTLTTPRGGQQKIVLSDGTQVWMNAASSLHFPTAFTGKERRVEVTGEVYFEVAKNASQPFIVSVNNAEIHVLGTHFNVMSYSDEVALTTTLLEGSVSFTYDNNSSILKPGQQSQLTSDGQVKVISDVNTDQVVAWKNEFFDFEGADIEQVMRQLARWYDVDIAYHQKPGDLFFAEIPRNTKLSDVLKALALTGSVKFEIEGRSIVVMP
ncbi:MAG: FecR domain-containing protein [Chitinophagales bacterium]